MADFVDPEVSISDLRVKIADVVNATVVDGKITYITNRGRRIAAIVPVRDGDEALRRRDEEAPAPGTQTLNNPFSSTAHRRRDSHT